jgi:hypothetical protein
VGSIGSPPLPQRRDRYGLVFGEPAAARRGYPAMDMEGIK